MFIERIKSIVIRAYTKRYISIALLIIFMLCFFGCKGNKTIPESSPGKTVPTDVTVKVSASKSETETVTEGSVTESEVTKSAKVPVKERKTLGGEEVSVTEDGTYTGVEDVSLYIHLYGHLPSNYITKNEAKALGWNSSKGNLWEVTDHKCIGGDRFGNYEESLPNSKGRIWKECDVNYNGGFRGAERLLYSNDGLIYYSNDHYETFTLLYSKDDTRVEKPSGSNTI